MSTNAVIPPSEALSAKNDSPRPPSSQNSTIKNGSSSSSRSLCKMENAFILLSRPEFDMAFMILLLVLECCLCHVIITHIPYTEIDWKAYMQEVSAYYVRGERNYLNIRGDTGPLVYPAGFVYLYGGLKWLSVCFDSGDEDDDEDGLLGGSTSAGAIRAAQWVFAGMYVANCGLVLALYQRALQRMAGGRALAVWSWRAAMALTCLSKRTHSIFLLRLFNDAPAITLLHLSLYLFSSSHLPHAVAWDLGCIVFSLAVSIKMNILLFAPGLLLLLLQTNAHLRATIRHLFLCAALQIVLAYPFLSTHPLNYLKKAFEFDRVFFHRWTVNWKFIPESLFVSKLWALALLLLGHFGTLTFLARKWHKASLIQRGAQDTWHWWNHWKSSKLSPSTKSTNTLLTPEYIIYTMFVSNYIGIVFARTLHYQFYSWYFHSLPMLHWMTFEFSSSCNNNNNNNNCNDNETSSLSRIISMFTSTIAIICIEIAFNTYPATNWSSAMLQLSHGLLLYKIIRSDVPNMLWSKTKNDTEKKDITHDKDNDDDYPYHDDDNNYGNDDRNDTDASTKKDQ